MKIKFSVYALLIAAATMTVSGCYKKELADFQQQIDEFKKYGVETLDTRVKTLEGQVAAIEVTITDLEGLREEVEGKIAEVNKTIEALKKDMKDGDDALKSDITALQGSVEKLEQQKAQIEQKITDLRTYVDEELKNTKDWVKGTFATIDQMNAVTKTITDIQAAIEQIQTIAQKYGKDIEGLKAAVEKLEKVEENLKSWVNKQLENYYDIATIESKLSLLSSTLTSSFTNADEALKKELEKEISDSYDKITEEYKAFVKLAIEVGGGEIGEEIQKQLNAIKSEMTEKFGAMNERISGLESSLIQLKSRVNNCEVQINNLSQYISYLERLYNELGGEIEILKQTVGGFDSRIEALELAQSELAQTIENLKKDLEEQIANSLKEAKSYTDELKTWTENSLKNYYTSTKVDELLAEIKLLVEGLDIKIKSLEGLEDTLHTWVLANCYTKTEIDNKLAQLKLDYASADEELKKEIKQLSDDLSKAKEEITSAYSKAIEEAINKLHGEITKETTTAIDQLITDRIAPLETRVKDIEDKLKDIEDRLGNLENSIKGRVTSIVAIPDFSNGAVKVPFDYASTMGSFTKKTAEIKYQVYPAGMAKKIADAYATDNNTVKIKYQNTISQSQAAADLKAVAGCAVDPSDADILVVTINGSDLADNFYKTQFIFNEHQAVNMSLFVFEKQTSADAYDVVCTADYVELYPYCPATLAFAPTSAAIGSFDWRQGSAQSDYAKNLKVTTKIASANAAKYVGWKVAEKPSWVNIYPEQSLYDSESTVKVFLNSTMTAREGTIKFLSASGEELTYPVSQIARPAQTLTTNPASGSTLYFKQHLFLNDSDYFVIVNTSDNVQDYTWEITYQNGDKWVSVLKSDDKAGRYSTLMINVVENETSSTRVAKLKLIPATGADATGSNCPVFTISQSN